MGLGVSSDERDASQQQVGSVPAAGASGAGPAAAVRHSTRDVTKGPGASTAPAEGTAMRSTPAPAAAGGSSRHAPHQNRAAATSGAAAGASAGAGATARGVNQSTGKRRAPLPESSAMRAAAEAQAAAAAAATPDDEETPSKRARSTPSKGKGYISIGRVVAESPRFTAGDVVKVYMTKGRTPDDTDPQYQVKLTEQGKGGAARCSSRSAACRCHIAAHDWC